MRQECGTSTASRGCISEGSGVLLLWAQTACKLPLESWSVQKDTQRQEKLTWYIPISIPYIADPDADIRCQEGNSRC